MHGGPGLDHHMFGDYLDALTDAHRLILVDQRAQGRSDPAPPDTWTLGRMAADVSSLAEALGLGRYAVLGHSYGAFVALVHAVDRPGDAAATIVSAGLPSVAYMDVEGGLARLPAELRAKVEASWANERDVRTPDDVATLWHDQLPYHFADPMDPRIPEYVERTSGAVYAPDVIRHFAANEYGGIDVEDVLDRVTQPVLALTGRQDHTCPPPGAEAIAKGVSEGELLVLEDSAHLGFVEETEAYLAAVREFLAPLAS
ncbi:MAG: alpha/beta fold hydrolase [Actinomycetota bacterium]